MESRICLIRHGITEGNKNKLYYGFADIPLAEEGIYQLKDLAAAGIYPEGDGADFYTSGLKRTEQTLELIYGQRKHETLESLREINFGDYEMKSHGELKDSEEYRIWRSDVMGSLAPPNGESLMAFYKRVVRGFEDLKNRHAGKMLAMRHKDQDALSITVCHGGTISAILESIYPRQKDNFYRWIPDPGHGYMLFLEDGAVIDTEKYSA